MPLACGAPLALVLANVAFRLARIAFEAGHLPRLTWLSADSVHVSGQALEEGKVWVLVAASFDHADWPHLANNMLMLACVAPELEASVGAARLAAAYVLCGSGGWLLNQAELRMRHGNEMWAGAARYQSSVGSSPATYGAAALLGALAPRGCCCTAVGLPAWVWLWLLWVLPVALDRGGGGAAPGRGPAAGRAAASCRRLPSRLLAAAAVAGLTALAARSATALLASAAVAAGHPGSEGGGCVPCAWFLPAYLLKTLLLKLADKASGRRPFFFAGADNASHLGGALCGLALASLFRSRAAAGSSAPPDPVSGAAVWCCVLYLAGRMAAGF